MLFYMCSSLSKRVFAAWCCVKNYIDDERENVIRSLPPPVSNTFFWFCFSDNLHWRLNLFSWRKNGKPFSRLSEKYKQTSFQSNIEQIPIPHYVQFRFSKVVTSSRKGWYPFKLSVCQTALYMHNKLNRSDGRDKPFSANFDQIYSYLN